MPLSHSHAAPAMASIAQNGLIDDALKVRNEEQIEFRVSYICQGIDRINSMGVWAGDDPFEFSVPLLLLQLSLISLVTQCFYVVLKPFGQTSIICQILGGMTLGPSVLGRNSAFSDKVFPAKGKNVLDTSAFFGFVIFIFLVGVKTDPTIIFRSGKRAVAIGVLNFFVPFALAGTVVFCFTHFSSLDYDVSKALPYVLVIQSMTAFPVIACFLVELQILNSEIGRLASASSIVCDICSWSYLIIKYAANITATRSISNSIGSLFSSILLILFIMFVARSASLWTIQQTPEGKPVKEIYIFGVIIVLLFCSFMGEVIGMSAFLVSFILGLAIPDGPPLGEALVDKFECFVSVLLMPILFTMCGLRTDVYAIQTLNNVGVIQLITCVAFCGKIIGTIVPLIFCRMPIRDALSLGFVMNCKGTVELAILISLKLDNVLNEECYAIMVLSIVLITGVVAPIVKALYDPSKKFLAYKRRTILHHNNNEELRILACIHKQDNVLAMLNLLTASNPTESSPIELVVLHLIKLVGRASSLLVAHVPREKCSQNPTQSEKIFNVFGTFEKRHWGQVTVHCFKGISPHATMHNDVCYVALDKRITLIIIPFHKQYMIGGRTESSFAFSHLNKNVLEKAPCSVGILIDRGSQMKFWCDYVKESTYQVAVLFFGGADDREALAYAGRMSEHPNVQITLIQISSTTEVVASTARSKMLDTQVLSDFRLNAFRNVRVFYKDVRIVSVSDFHLVIDSIKSAYDLVMVGRKHADSQLMSELRKWKHGDLGTIGEILSTVDFDAKTSILVVQQQTRLWGLRDPEESTHLRRVNISI